MQMPQLTQADIFVLQCVQGNTSEVWNMCNNVLTRYHVLPTISALEEVRYKHHTVKLVSMHFIFVESKHL